MTKTIRYNLIGAYEAGIKDGMQKDIERLGMKIINFKVFYIADCIMVKVENVPEKLPYHMELWNYEF